MKRSFKKPKTKKKMNKLSPSEWNGIPPDPPDVMFSSFSMTPTVKIMFDAIYRNGHTNLLYFF
jgi:hypothetical protein